MGTGAVRAGCSMDLAEKDVQPARAVLAQLGSCDNIGPGYRLSDLNVGAQIEVGLKELSE